MLLAFLVVVEERTDFVDRPIDIIVNDGVFVTRHGGEFGGCRFQSRGYLCIGFGIPSPQATFQFLHPAWVDEQRNRVELRFHDFERSFDIDLQNYPLTRF